MSEHKRPGGLTALAIINFVWGGISILGVLISAAVIPFMGQALEQLQEDPNVPPETLAQMEALTDINGGLFLSMLLLSLIISILLIVAGVGYLKLKKFLGRTLGNAYAVLSIISSIATAVTFPVALGGGFNILAIIGLIYPVLTLILLNTTFRDDFVN